MNLTKPQKLIYDMEKFAGGAIAVICGSMLINGKKDLSELKRAVNEIYHLNDALRIRINETDGEVLQTVTEYTEQDVPVLCFENKAELDAYAENYAKTPMDFYGNLCEVSIVTLPNKCGLLVKLHHIIGDAWTLSLLGTQFNKLINSENVDTYSYTDYVESESAYLTGKRYEKDRQFFLSQFKKFDEVTYLSEKQTDSLNACRKTFVIDKEKTKQINDYAQQKGTSAFMLFMAALSAYMNRTKMNAEKFYIGTAVLNRNSIKEKNTAGMFINTVPMLIELDNTKSFAENLSGIEDTAFSIFRHQKYNYGDVLTDIRKEYGFNEKLYDVMISYQNATITGADIETTWYHSGEQSESLQMHIDDRDNEGIFRVHYDYHTEKFTEHEIEMLHQHICNLLFDAISDSDKKLYELDIMTADEQQKLLYDFNDTAVDYPRDKCVHQLFEEQAAKTPDKTAVVACDKTLTYKELNEEANKIAHSLIEKGVGVGDIVAFMLPRRSYLIATMLGILKSGAAYMPIDPDYPQDRIDYMLSDSGAKFCITESNISELLNNENTNNPCVSMTSESLCYCIYTSGSTGKPKGTSILHKNLVNLLLDNSKYFKNSRQIALLTTICFDVATQEIFCTLVYGLSGYLFQNKNSMSVVDVCKIVTEQKIDVLFATPTYFDMLTKQQEYAEVLLKQLKLVILAGEMFYLNDSVRNSNCKDTVFVNQYGPAETHVSTCCVIKNNNIAFASKNTAADYQRDKCVHQLFEEQAAKTPDKTAVIACDKTLTYKELNEQANRIAHSLIQKGVKVGDIVAFALPRKSYLIAAIFGILKSGAAYMPIDPDYPQDRIDYMLSDSGAKFCITESNISELMNNENTNNPPVDMTSENLFCCIYTSGSTGQPKGVILSHNNFGNYFSKNIYIDHILECETAFCISNVIFDMFINEIFSALLFGLKLVFASETEMNLPHKLADLIKNHKVESIICTPTKFSIYLNNENFKQALSGVKLITLGGEVLSADLCNNIHLCSNAVIINGYGPTETTIVSTYGVIK